jgi:hypothetical protein
VDNYLMRLSVPFLRYVDDFRIFCESRKQAIETRHALSEYLFAVHRLSLESSKSGVFYVARFVSEELSDPEETSRQAEVEKLNELLIAIAEAHDGYSFEIVEGEEKELLGKAEKESLISLFQQCVQRPPLHLGLARYLLRRALQSRTVVLNSLVFERLEALAPVMRDVMRYLAVTIPKNQAAARGQDLLSFCRTSDVGSLPFVRMWVLDLLANRPDLCSPTEALACAESSSGLGIRPTALLAATHKQIDWVRAKKETWRNHEPWDRRALIWSASALPSGERKPFLTMVSEQGDQLDAAVAKYLMSQI